MRLVAGKILCYLTLIMITGCSLRSNQIGSNGITGKVAIDQQSLASLNFQGNSMRVFEPLRQVLMGEPKVYGDQMIIRFDEGVSKARIEEILESFSLTVLKELLELNVYKVGLPKGAVWNDLATALGKIFEIKYVSENRSFIRPTIIGNQPNDPYFQDSSQTNLQRIAMPQAWELLANQSKVKVAVIDGCFFSHQDLNFNTTLGYDYFHQQQFAFESEDSSFAHGSHVAGIIAATANNSLGIAGIVWNVELIPITIFGYNENHALISADSLAIAQAIQYAVNVGAKIINMSWGSDYDDQLIADVLLNAYQHGVTLVAAVGNDGNDGGSVKFPARLNYVIAVGASNLNNQRCDFSSLGTTNRAIDLLAPGDCILSTVANNSYQFYGGTSMASPHVAGIAALLYGLGITTPSLIKQYLTKNALDIGAVGVDQNTGWGIVNALGAIGIAKTKVLLMNTTSQIVVQTLMVNSDGSYQFAGVPAGHYRIQGWIDTNLDQQVNAGDYYAESSEEFYYDGKLQKLSSLVVHKY